MTELLSRYRVDELCARAERHYNPDLPYHNWSHAEEVMANVVHILDNFLGGRQNFGPATRMDRGLLLIAAAHHDSGYDDPRAAEHPSKEHFAARLAEQDLAGELDTVHIEAVKSMILGTRFQAARQTREEVTLHYADIWNMTREYPSFLDHSVRLWVEYGRPDWDTFRQQSKQVIETTINESRYQRPISFNGMAAAWGADPFYFSPRAQSNLEHFMQEPEPKS